MKQFISILLCYIYLSYAQYQTPPDDQKWNMGRLLNRNWVQNKGSTSCNLTNDICGPVVFFKN
jgi:hypothetical protein